MAGFLGTVKCCTSTFSDSMSFSAEQQPLLLEWTRLAGQQELSFSPKADPTTGSLETTAQLQILALSLSQASHIKKFYFIDIEVYIHGIIAMLEGQALSTNQGIDY